MALVERGPRSVRLTEAGRALVAHTDGIVASLAAAEAEIQAIAGLRGGMLRLASFPTAYATIMPQAIAEFRRRHPAVELSLTEVDPLASLARIKSGELDLGLMYEYDFVPFPEDDSVQQTAPSRRPDPRCAPPRPPGGAPARGEARRPRRGVVDHLDR